MFIPKTEVLKPTIINEAEGILKEKKVDKTRKLKGKNFERFDFERHVSEVIYEKPEMASCAQHVEMT